MSTNSNRPFAGPRVNLPSHFPKSFRNSQPDNPCRYLITKLSEQTISSSDFFTQLLSIQNENREISFSILNCLLFYVLHCKPYHSKFCSQFTALFTKLILNPSEPVRRSVLPLISMLINNTAVLKSLSAEFDTWKDESKEIFLSFAFCFQPPEVFEWKHFMQNAEASSNSENESLSCTANDFIEYMNYFLVKDSNAPKVRNSMDFTKEQFRRSMNFRNSMDFDQNSISESLSENKNEEENDAEFDDDENFVLEDSSINYNRNSYSKNKTESSARSSQNSDIRSLRVSKQQNAMEELENDPFNQKSPFFNSLENDQDDSNISGLNRQSKKSIKSSVSDSLEDNSSILPNRTNKPQVIESVDITKMKKENNSRKSSKTSHSKESSHSQSKSRKEASRSSNKSAKSNKSNDIYNNDVEIDDTNIDIADIDDIDLGFDDKTNSSGNLSDILENESFDMASLLPKNISPQKSNASSRSSHSKPKTEVSSQSKIPEHKTKSSHSKLYASSDSNKQKAVKTRSETHNEDVNISKDKHQKSEVSKNPKKNDRTNQSDAQTMKPASKSKQQQKASNNRQSLNDQPSVFNNDGVSFHSQSNRPPSARRNRQTNVSSSDSSINMQSSGFKLDSQLNFVDIDGVDDSNILNPNNRNSSKLTSNNSNVNNIPLNYDEDDDEYSDDLFGAAPDYENKVTFSGPPLPNTPDNSASSSHPSPKRKLPKKSGNSKTMSPSLVKKRPDSRSSNSSTESIPLKTKSSSRNANSSSNEDDASSNVYDYVSNLNNKDWEQQQRSVEGLRCLLNTKPGLVSPYCREIWMNLLDIIVSPRSMLSNAALQLAAELFTQFAPQLVSQTALFVDICFNLVCNSRQFISEGAENVIILIAQESPRSKVLNSFVKGTTHKNPIARAKASQCLAILVEQEGKLDDREFKAVVQCLIPLIRDNRTETRYAAKETLKLIADDERFKDIAKDICTNALDYNELMKCVEV